MTPQVHGEIQVFTEMSKKVLPRLRGKWILQRKDVTEIDGRTIKPSDNGYLS